MSSYFWGPRVSVNSVRATSAAFGQVTTSAASLTDATVQTPNARDGYDVIVLVGDGNMVGLGGAGQLSAVLDYGDATMQQLPARTFAPGPVGGVDPLRHPYETNANQGASIGTAFGRLHARTSGRNVLLVPAAVPGSFFDHSLSSLIQVAPNEMVFNNWRAGEHHNNLVGHAVQRANVAMAYHPVHNPFPGVDGAPLTPHAANRLAAILWHQGTTDLAMPAEQYRDRLSALVGRLRTSIAGASDAAANATPFVAGLPTGAVMSAYASTGPAAVVPRIADAAYFGRPRCVPVGIYDPATDANLAATPGNDALFTNAAVRELGRRYYAAFAAPPSAPVPLFKP